MDYIVHGIQFSRPKHWSGWLFTSPGHPPNPVIEPRSPTLRVDSLPVEPQGKPKNTAVGSLSLLQQIFQTQELNQGFLNCRWILYKLSYQGSPNNKISQFKRGSHSIIRSQDSGFHLARTLSLLLASIKPIAMLTSSCGKDRRQTPAQSYLLKCSVQ